MKDGIIYAKPNVNIESKRLNEISAFHPKIVLLQVLPPPSAPSLVTKSDFDGLWT